MNYADNIFHKYIEAIVHAGHSHLGIDGKLSTHHLADSRAELDNRTCKEAFLTTFTSHFQSTNLSHPEHDTIVRALTNFTHEVIHTLHRDIDFAVLFLNAKNIITSYTD